MARLGSNLFASSGTRSGRLLSAGVASDLLQRHPNIREPSIYTSDKAAGIAHAVAKIHAASYERDLPTPVNVDIGENRIICHVSFELTEVDQLLLRRGMHDTMKAARDAFEVTLSPAMTAAVERATGRTVLAHTSHTDLHARVTIESFSLRDATPDTPGG